MLTMINAPTGRRRLPLTLAFQQPGTGRDRWRLTARAADRREPARCRRSAPGSFRIRRAAGGRSARGTSRTSDRSSPGPPGGPGRWQRSIAQLTDHYLGLVALRARPRLVDSRRRPGDRAGAPRRPGDRVRRGGAEVWGALAAGEPRGRRRARAARLASVTATDLQLARLTPRAGSSASSRPIGGRRASFAPSRGTCRAALRTGIDCQYHVEDLLPIHPGCDCDVEPLLRRPDPRRRARRISRQVHALARDFLAPRAPPASTGTVASWTTADFVIVHEMESSAVLARQGQHFQGTRAAVTTGPDRDRATGHGRPRRARRSSTRGTINRSPQDGRPILPIAGASPEGDPPAGDKPPAGSSRGPACRSSSRPPDPAAEIEWKALARREAQSRPTPEAAKKGSSPRSRRRTDGHREGHRRSGQRGRSLRSPRGDSGSSQPNSVQRLPAWSPTAAVMDLNLASCPNAGDVDQDAVKALREK